MRHHRLIIILSLLLLPLTQARGQMRELEELDFRETRAFMLGGEYTVTSEVVLDRLHLGTNQMLILVPELRSRRSSDHLLLRPILVVGANRSRMMARERALGYERDYMRLSPLSTTIRRSGEAQSVTYTLTVPSEAWMRHAGLVIRGWLVGCAECGEGEGERTVEEQLLYTPHYRPRLITPEVEPVKSREDRYTATIAYRVDRSEVDPEYGGNRPILDDVHARVRSVLDNKDITVHDITIRGYASPEAPVPYNKSLSERRAGGFTDYLVARYGLDRSSISVSGEGEDWVETTRLIEADSTVLTREEREEVLGIIRSISEPDRRDAPLKALHGGTTYRKLLDHIYTRVRRTEYAFAYVVRPFDLEEARQIARTNPRLLSLNELYLVATSYDPESRESKEVYELAALLFPSEPVALINAAASDLERGDPQRALERLAPLREDPRARTNLAIAYAMTGGTERALELLRTAVEEGDPAAEVNLRELERLIAFRAGGRK